MRQRDLLSLSILGLASALGLWAIFSPLLTTTTAVQHAERGMAHGEDAPFLLAGLVGLCLLVIVANLETQRMDARVVALLGVLVGLNACLRVVSGPFGASAVFFLPILCGYVLGADFGFLLAALSVLASALLTGGLGPWLPFQMFAVGWCGMLSGFLPRFERSGGGTIALLAFWGAVSGFLAGAILNLWFWPYLADVAPGQGFEPGEALWVHLKRYGVFYLATSSWWDAGRALGNAVLLATAGLPVLHLLERFERRFRFQLGDTEEEAL